jgi:hypothetical protein
MSKARSGHDIRLMMSKSMKVVMSILRLFCRNIIDKRQDGVADRSFYSKGVIYGKE